MKIHVYILILSNETYYTGITKNLPNRLKQHNSGSSRSTNQNLPVRCIWSCPRDSYKLARQLEKKIKNSGAKRFIDRLIPCEVYKGKGKM